MDEPLAKPFSALVPKMETLVSLPSLFTVHLSIHFGELKHFLIARGHSFVIESLLDMI